MPGKKIHIDLFGGEQDGWEFKEFFTKSGRRPDVVYVHRACDTQRIKEAPSEELKSILTNSLAVLAYRFDKIKNKDGVTGGKQYRYVRHPDADRSLKEPCL